MLKGLPGKFPPKFSLCPTLVWSWDPELSPPRSLPSQSTHGLTGRATEGRRDGGPAWTRVFQALSRRTSKISFLSLWSLFCLFKKL